MVHVFCVFLCFFIPTDPGTYLPMCFTCFCVFLPNKLQFITNVFCVFLYLANIYVPLQARVVTQCVLCVFVFFLQIDTEVYFKPGQTPNVFYVFLCFLSGHWKYHSCILCVFVSLFQIDLRPPMCFTCFCVFLNMNIQERFSM